MTIPLVTVIDPVPLRSATPEPQFRADVEEFLEELPPFTTEFNASVTAMNATATTIDGQATQVAADAAMVEGVFDAILNEDLGDAVGASASSVTIGNGSKGFIADAGKLWRAGQWLMIRSAANPANYMAGPITAYDVSDGNPLTVDVRATGGSGTFADWQIYPTNEVAVPPGLTLLQSGTISSPVAAVDITSGIDSTYDEYELHLFNFVPSASASLALRLSINGGSSYLSGAGDYAWATMSYSIAAGPNRAGNDGDKGQLTQTTISTNAAHGGYSGKVIISRPNDGGQHLTINAIGLRSTAFDASGLNEDFAVIRAPSIGSVNALRLLMSTGNIASGKYKLYGVKK